MRKEEYKVIDGVKYLCKMLPGDVAIELEMELLQRIGRPATAMMSRAFLSNPNASTMDDLGTSVEGLIAGGMNVFLTELSPKDAREYMMRAMEGVEAEGVGPVHGDAFANHFRGRMMHMKKVFVWSMEVNYRDFFSVALSHPLIGALVGSVKRAFSDQTSTPSSDGSSSRQVVSTAAKPTEEVKPG